MNVAVIEAPPKRLEGGVGYSTDVQFRGNATYRDVNIDGTGLQMLIDGRLESKLQSASIRFTQPPNDCRLDRHVHRRRRCAPTSRAWSRAPPSFGTRWHTIEERNERALSATFYLDEQQPAGAEWERSHAIYLEYERYWRRIDNLHRADDGLDGEPAGRRRHSGRLDARLRPRRSAASPRGCRSTPRTSCSSARRAARCSRRRATAFRRRCSSAPAATRRCAATRSRASACRTATRPLPGRYYAVFNVEVTHWIREAWGIAAFVDAGNAIDTLSDAHLALGYGVGLRVRTPLGPFRVDLAYGQDVHKVRVHLSVGLTF